MDQAPATWIPYQPTLSSQAPFYMVAPPEETDSRRSGLVPREPLWSPGPQTPPLALFRDSP